MLARLTIYQPDRPARQFILDEASRYLIGRDTACSIQLDDDRLSRRHAKIEFVDRSWWVSDLCSKNGTVINGRPITLCELKDQQWFEIGGLVAYFDRITPEVLEEERRRLAERWNTSIELSRTLKPTDDLDTMLAQALQAFAGAAGAERGYVVLLTDGGETRLHASLPAGTAIFGGSRTVIDRTMEQHEAVVCSDVSLDSSLVDQASIVGGGIAALVSIPLMVGDRLLGVIYVDSRESGRHYTERDAEILRALADHVALVIGVSLLREESVDLTHMLPRELSREPAAHTALLTCLQQALQSLYGPPEISVGG